MLIRLKCTVIGLGLLCFLLVGCDAFGLMLPIEEAEVILSEATPYMLERDVFCEDERPLQLIADLQDAVQNRDGEVFTGLVAPHGLYMSLNSGTTLHLSVDEVRNFFVDDTIRNWGIEPYGRQSLSASLAGDMADLLVRDLLPDTVTIACNDNQDGLSNTSVLYNIIIPEQSTDYISNFYSVLRPTTNPNLGHDWGAWGIAFAYWDGAPLIIAMTHYGWNP